MKIVLGTHHYPPRYVAGVELIAARLAGRLVGRGHQVEVVCVEEIDANQPLTVATAEQDGVTVHRLGLQLTGQPVGLGVRYQDVLVRDWFADFFARARPEIFHSHSSYLLTVAPLEAARAAGVKTVVTLHDYWFLCPRLTLLRSDGRTCQPPVTPDDCAWCVMGERRRYQLPGAMHRRLGDRVAGRLEAAPWRWMMDRRIVAMIEERQTYVPPVLDQVDLVISPAPLARDLLARQGMATAERVRLVRYGLETEVPMARAPRPAGRVRVGYLGQIAPHKGVHLLVEAVKALTGSATTIDLHVHGDPTRFAPYAAQLHREARGVSSISFHGTYDNRRVGEILSGLDVIVVPSTWYEVSPLVILEAFSAGVPVIASRYTNLASLITDEQDGLLFTPGDAADLARQLRRLVKEPGLLARLTAGVRPIRTVDDEVDDLEHLYRSVTRQPAPARSLATPGDTRG